ncbi:hypothetical protein BFJ68_g17417 [Fusarium oxysporum]|uniref:Uncharacterized protein n=1 Tax=Fusarium oxysporum TaxID=5507 RepID=A0A420NU42_FUSOX|nr:hypothetical protein BFJ68_g17417 [Fusarium oxysporum]
MTSTSDREGFCQRCGCANGVHRFGQCRGKNKGGRCDFEWVRCTITGHSDYFEGQYIDCFRCWQHPGAPPKDFWGTQPDDDIQVPTADEIGLPYPAQEGSETYADSSNAGPSGHARTFSTETASTDPLQWDEARYEQETTSLTQRLDNIQLQDNTISSANSIYVDTYPSKHQGRICFVRANGKEVTTKEKRWQSSYVDFEGEMVACLFYVDDSGQYYYTWAHGTGETGESSTGRRKTARGHKR